MPKKYIQFVPENKTKTNRIQLTLNNNYFIYLITKIEFVGVVSLFGNGLLRANAAQLQKIVNNTKYSNGLERIEEQSVNSFYAY